MDEFTYDAFVNREDSIPVINFEDVDELDENEPPERKRDRLKKQASNMKGNLRKKGVETGTSLQDRMLEKYVQVKYFMK
jgi:hypothetical protein